MYTVVALCHLSHVTPSGYYAWKQRTTKPQKDHDRRVLISYIFTKWKGKHGARRILMELNQQGHHMSLGKIYRIMKKDRLITTVRRGNPYKRAPKASAVTTSENVLRRQFLQIIIRQFFCTDITYIPWGGSFIYLSTVKDIATGEIVAWKCSRSIDMHLVLDTLDHLRRNMLTHLWPLSGALLHSDRGTHYTGPQWTAAVKELGMTPSMSRVGRCIDNAPMESFFGHFKDDVDFSDCTTFDMIALRIDQYMRHYNNDRPQWEKKKMTPVEYRNHLLAK